MFTASKRFAFGAALATSAALVLAAVALSRGGGEEGAVKWKPGHYIKKGAAAIKSSIGQKATSYDPSKVRALHCARLAGST